MMARAPERLRLRARRRRRRRELHSVVPMQSQIWPGSAARDRSVLFSACHAETALRPAFPGNRVAAPASSGSARAAASSWATDQDSHWGQSRPPGKTSVIRKAIASVRNIAICPDSRRI